MLGIYAWIVKVRRFVVNVLVNILRPVGYVLDKIEHKVTKIRRGRITEEKAYKVVVRALARYVVRYGKAELLVASSAVDDDLYMLSFEGKLGMGWSVLKSRKQREMGRFLRMDDVKVQRRILREVEKVKGIQVEEVEFEIKPYWKIEDFGGLYNITYRG